MGRSWDTPEPELRRFGSLIRQFRGRRSLRALAKEVYSSRSTLSRLERGELQRLDAALIERLDEAFDAGGTLIAERQQLLRGAGELSQRGVWRRRWMHYYPADYCGEV
jgi:transcriptional regulator with XRE-family HTH domain